MLVKVKNGASARMIHVGVRYYFAPGEIKDCPESILLGYRGILVSAEPPQVTQPTPQKMPVISIETPKIKIPVKVKTGKIKNKTKK